MRRRHWREHEAPPGRLHSRGRLPVGVQRGQGRLGDGAGISCDRRHCEFEILATLQGSKGGHLLWFALGLQEVAAGDVKLEGAHAQQSGQPHLGAVGDLVEAGGGVDEALHAGKLLSVSLGQGYKFAQKLDGQGAPLCRS